MRSGKLAYLSGVSSDTLRYYERVGILPVPQRSPANYRDYPLASVQRVQLIQRALKIGFSLDELKTILGLRDRGGAPCRHVRKLLQSKIRDVESQLKHLMEMRGELGRIAKDWDRLLARARGKAARWLENLPGELPSAVGLRLLRRGRIKRG
jgi:DNA-binding transcriptional MerR regulator